MSPKVNASENKTEELKRCNFIEIEVKKESIAIKNDAHSK